MVCQRRIFLLFSFLCLLFSAGRANALQFGRLSVEPLLVLEGVYDDNIFLTSEDTKDSWIGRVRPEIEFAYDYGPTDFLLFYGTEFQFYSEPDEPDSIAKNHRFGLSLEHMFGERTSILVDNQLFIGTDVPELAGLGLENVRLSAVLPGNRDFRINRFAFEINHMLTRLFGLTGEMAYNYSWYGATEGPSGQPVDEQNEVRLGISGNYAWHPSNSFIVSLGFTYGRFNNGISSQIYLLSFGDFWQISEHFSIEAAAGAQFLLETTQWLPFDIFTNTTFSAHPYGNLALFYEVADFVFDAYATYGVQNSTVLTTPVLSLTTGAGLSYNPFEPLTLRAYGSYTKDDAVDDLLGEDVDSFQVGAGADYEVLNWLTTVFRYVHIDQRGERTRGETYKNNRFTLGVILTLPESLG